MIRGKAATNECGDALNDGVTPQTSRFYPGEEVSSVVWAEWGEFGYLNLNGARFGRLFRDRGSNRINGGSLIAAGGWGNILIGANSFGVINAMLSQANPRAWAADPRPHVLNLSNGMIFTATTIRRVTGQDSGAPGVVDSGGSRWGRVQSRQNLSHGGVLFRADAVGIKASVDARGASVALHTTSGCDALDVDLYFNNVGTAWLNERLNLNGRFKIEGTLNAGQTFSTGVLSGPGVAKEALRKADISFVDNGTRKNNSFHGAATVATDATGGKTATFTHNLWRLPLVEDIQLTFRHSGFTTPAEVSPPYINGFSATTVTARVDVKAAHVGASVTSQVICVIA